VKDRGTYTAVNILKRVVDKFRLKQARPVQRWDADNFTQEIHEFGAPENFVETGGSGFWGAVACQLLFTFNVAVGSIQNANASQETLSLSSSIPM
jgi:hypothetical protein